jgi:putative ABC transport system ATP-binding protein
MEKIIELKGIHKYYKMPGFTVKALDGIDITINKGEFIALVGPSGSGKSTLMNVIGCLDVPTSGEYWLNGEDVSNLSDSRLAEIRSSTLGFVFQSFNLMSNLNALDNIALPGKYQKMSSRECKRKARVAINKVGLLDRAKHLPKELSGGQQQRIAFARALVCNPMILLADEPTGNLDSKTGEEILELICELNKQGMTIILVTHDNKVANIAKRKIELFDGKIIKDEKKGGAA